ncbi:uncharacterized [Tachysurus ichikawai]
MKSALPVILMLREPSVRPVWLEIKTSEKSSVFPDSLSRRYDLLRYIVSMYHPSLFVKNISPSPHKTVPLDICSGEAVRGSAAELRQASPLNANGMFTAVWSLCQSE